MHEKKQDVPKERANAAIYPAVINESMAKHFWPGESAIGQIYSRGSDTGPWQQVIGVVNDVREWGLTEKPVPEGYTVFNDGSHPILVLHTQTPPAGATVEVRRILAQLDSSLPLSGVRTMSEVIDEGARGTQFLSLLVGAFAAFAALLAAVGIYGVLSYVVTQRTREIGIRMSLGASRGLVLRQVLGEGMQLALLGFGLGIAGALAVGRVMASLLHDVKPNDPGVLAGTTLLLAIIALAACLIPARRAASLDPMKALRHD
jgi:hypothetical protein